MKSTQTPRIRGSPEGTQNPRRAKIATAKRTYAYCGHEDH